MRKNYSMLKLWECFINVIKDCGFRLLCLLESCNYEERKVLIHLLHDGEIDEAKYTELSEACSCGKLTFEKLGVDEEKLHKAISALHDRSPKNAKNFNDPLRKANPFS